jgi:hypothetical protein
MMEGRKTSCSSCAYVFSTESGNLLAAPSRLESAAGFF